MSDSSHPQSEPQPAPNGATRVPAVPALQYEALGGDQLLTGGPENIPLLQDAADAYCGRRFLRKQAVEGLITCAVLAALGIWTLRSGFGGGRTGAALLVVSVVLGALSAVGWLWPIPLLCLIEAAATFAISGWLAFLLVRGVIRAGTVHVGAAFLSVIVLLVFWSGLGWLRRYRRYRHAAGFQPTEQVARWLEAWIERLRKAKPKDEPSVVQLTAFPPPFGVCKAQLLPDMVVCLLDGHELRFQPRDGFVIEWRAKGDSKHDVKVRATLGAGTKPVRAVMREEQFVRYQRWSADAVQSVHDSSTMATNDAGP